MWGWDSHSRKCENGFLWDSRKLRARFQGQVSLHLIVLGLIEILKCRCPKWPHMTHLDICSLSYGQKKGRESNCQFDSPPLKVKNRSLPDVRLQSATWRWKTLEKSYNFDWDLASIRLCSREIWAFKVLGLQPGTVSRLFLESPEKKSHLDINSAESWRVYCMGEGDGFPGVRAVMSQMCQSARGLSQHPRVFSNMFLPSCGGFWMQNQGR
jgi:hypothetical protein